MIQGRLNQALKASQFFVRGACYGYFDLQSTRYRDKTFPGRLGYSVGGVEYGYSASVLGTLKRKLDRIRLIPPSLTR